MCIVVRALVGAPFACNRTIPLPATGPLMVVGESAGGAVAYGCCCVAGFVDFVCGHRACLRIRSPPAGIPLLLAYNEWVDPIAVKWSADKSFNWLVVDS